MGKAAAEETRTIQAQQEGPPEKVVITLRSIIAQKPFFLHRVEKNKSDHIKSDNSALLED